MGRIKRRKRTSVFSMRTRPGRNWSMWSTGRVIRVWGNMVWQRRIRVVPQREGFERPFNCGSHYNECRKRGNSNENVSRVQRRTSDLNYDRFRKTFYIKYSEYSFRITETPFSELLFSTVKSLLRYRTDDG